ncbi:MAG: pyruvate kinase [Elusimicrobiota bacterium]|jgi:pyruvate kinase|nr:pyruvate kinase [Elusimicrobiota bacterium]
MTSTGIICTLGPATHTVPILKELAQAGMTVVRLNFSHGTYEDYEEIFKLVSTVNENRKTKIKILADLAGHRIRLGKFKNGQVQLKKGQKVILTNRPIQSNEKEIYIDYGGSFTDIKKGTEIYIDDGNLSLKVLSAGEDELCAEVQMDYVLKSNKGVNIPDAKLKFPLMEDKDRSDMIFALDHGVDFVANSFVRDAADMVPLREILQERKDKKCKLIAKIENRSGIYNLDSILDASDGIMVARGDMGISIPLWTVPIVQKHIIKKCASRKKFSITATQMLESMVENPIPTRAEVSDIANAIIDGSNYVMLSAETAVGAHPVEAVTIMHKIIQYTTKNLYRL